MPLPQATISEVMNYCKKHLPTDPNWFLDEFNFIQNKSLQKELAKEFYTTRYQYKLMEALAVTGQELHAHLKLQIIQYASIYEACINYLLTEQFKNHPAVLAIKTHRALKEVSALSKLSSISYANEKALVCIYKDTKTPWTSIAFDDKINASIAIGFIKPKLGQEILDIYKMRNTVHIDAAAKRQLSFQVTEGVLAYRRMRPFIDGIKSFLAKNPSPSP